MLNMQSATDARLLWRCHSKQPCLQRVEDSQESAPEGVAQHGPALSVDKHQQRLGTGWHILYAVVLPLQLRGSPPGAAPLVARTGQLRMHTTLEWSIQIWHVVYHAVTICRSVVQARSMHSPDGRNWVLLILSSSQCRYTCINGLGTLLV